MLLDQRDGMLDSGDRKLDLLPAAAQADRLGELVLQPLLVEVQVAEDCEREDAAVREDAAGYEEAVIGY